MLTIDWQGRDALDAKLAGYADALLAELDKLSQQLAAALAAKVVDEKLAGGVLQSRSGALAASIQSDVVVEPDAVVATVGSTGVKYAAIQEYGGRTSPHEIVPTKAQALAFISNGQQTFAKRVEHPGSDIPSRSYLRSSLEELQPDIVATLAAAGVETWGRS